MSVAVAFASTLTITEVIGNNTGSATDANRTVTHSNYNITKSLTAVTGQPVTQTASFLLTLSSGAATIDLRAMTGTNGASVDGNGLKVQFMRIKNLGANIMTFSVGASNGHNLFTADGFIVPPGGSVTIDTDDDREDIDATHKTIDIAGTGSQTAEITIVVG